MQPNPDNILADALKRLLRRKAENRLRKIVNRTHPVDLSRAFRFLHLAEQRKLFDMIQSAEHQGHLLSELDIDGFLKLVEEFPNDRLVKILEQIPNDDAADLIGRLPEERGQALLEAMKHEDAEEVTDLLRYDHTTAGGIMVADYFALNQNTTARDAIASLQKEHLDVEMPFYLYVVDDEGRLVGVSSLRQLVMVSPDTALKDFMSREVFTVLPDMDQEEVARIVARYDILAVPVTDRDRRLLGIVTVDDVIDIIRKEATEDILKMAGAGEEFAETTSILRSSRARLPWLFASCIGGILAFFIIGHFETTLEKIVYLAAFIPVIMGMGGNVGTQSSTIIVRGLATGRIHLDDLGTVVLRELAVGAILGTFYGFLLGAVAHTRYDVWKLGVVVGGSVVSTMSLAALVGSLVPMSFARLGIDPAIATGPFVTTAIDILSVLFYFSFATFFLTI
jgi:magnesium transporter